MSIAGKQTQTRQKNATKFKHSARPLNFNYHFHAVTIMS